MLFSRLSLLLTITILFGANELKSESMFTEALPLLLNPADVEYKRYCSSTLSEAIEMICNGRTNSLGHKFPDSVGHHSALRSITKRSAPEEIFHRPLQNGPIHECCRRPCGYDELKQYCAPD